MYRTSHNERFTGVIKNKSFTTKKGKNGRIIVTDLETKNKITLKKASIKKADRNISKVSLKVKGAKKNKKRSTGYQIQVSNSKSKLRKGKSLVTNKIVNIKKIKHSRYNVKNKKFNNRTLYARVRTYVLINGKRAYGKWSNIKTIK